MNSRTNKALVGYGIPSDLIEKVGKAELTVATLKTMSKQSLAKRFGASDGEILFRKLQRPPIPQDTVNSILMSSGKSCAYCRDGNSASPYEIHHIEHFASTQDHSLGNLVLVCPTHHQRIHDTSESCEEQKRKREEWAAIVRVATAFAQKGVSFPYGAFAPVIYGFGSTIEELFVSFSASPDLSQRLSDHPVAKRAAEILTQQNFLIVSGEPGSGKSTLALGIAGRSNPSAVFRYRAPEDPRAALKEVLQFIECSSRDIVLILDDANVWASRSDLDALRRASSPRAKLILCATNVATKSSDDWLVNHTSTLAVVRWADLRSSVRAKLLANETAVVKTLRRLREGDIVSLGIGPLTVGLSSLIARYEKQARSAWHFVFLMRGEWHVVTEILRELAQADRSDLILLYLSVEQIAGFERTVSGAEIVATLRPVFEEHKLGPLDEDWVIERLNSAVRKHLAVSFRTRFTTIHRDWARAIISTALAQEDTSEAARSILARVFDSSDPNPRRTLILWSWLRLDRFGGVFAEDWAAALSEESWVDLLERAADDGLVVVGMLSDRMHLLFRHPNWSQTVGNVFSKGRRKVAQLLRDAQASDWYWIKDIFQCVGYASPAAGVELLEDWGHENAARLFSSASARDFESLTWWLAAVERNAPAWLGDFKQLVDARVLVSAACDGSIEQISKLPTILTHLDLPLRRSDVTRLAQALHDCLATAQLADLTVEPEQTWLWLEAFPTELHRAATGLDHSRFLTQLKSSPRYWMNLLLWCAFSKRGGTDFAQKLIDELDDEFIEQVKEVATDETIVLRPLLWTLTYGSESKRSWLAKELENTVILACENCTPDDKRSLLKAYVAVDGALGKALADSLEVPVDSPNYLSMLHEGLLQQSEHAKPLLDELSELDAAGEDFDVLEVLNRYLYGR